jgi:hypothetical protein
MLTIARFFNWAGNASGKGAAMSVDRCNAHQSGDDLQHDDGGNDHASQKSKKDVDRELDKALKDSFPSSDPPSLSQPTKNEPAGDPNVKP